jgi:hypothetical protein
MFLLFRLFHISVVQSVCKSSMNQIVDVLHTTYVSSNPAATTNHNRQIETRKGMAVNNQGFPELKSV